MDLCTCACIYNKVEEYFSVFYTIYYDDIHYRLSIINLSGKVPITTVGRQVVRRRTFCFRARDYDSLGVMSVYFTLRRYHYHAITLTICNFNINSEYFHSKDHIFVLLQVFTHTHFFLDSLSGR